MLAQEAVRYARPPTTRAFPPEHALRTVSIFMRNWSTPDSSFLFPVYLERVVTVTTHPNQHSGGRIKSNPV